MSFTAFLICALFAASFENHLEKSLLDVDNVKVFEPFFEFLQNFHEFHLILHIENATQIVANEFVRRYEILTSVYNHDLQNARKMTRPAALKVLHLAALRHPLKLCQYLEQHRNVFNRDIVMFVVSNDTLKTIRDNIWLIPNLSRAGSILIIELMNAIKVFNVCFYCGKQSGQLVHQAYTNGQKFRVKIRTFRSLHQHWLKVAYVNYFPYFFCSDEKCIGTELQLLEVIGKKMHFNYELIHVENTQKLIEDMIAKKFDLALGGVSITNQRRRLLQFSAVLRFEQLAAMFNYRESLGNILTFNDFTVYYWLTRIVSCCVLSFVLYAVLAWINGKKPNAGKLFEVLFRAFFEQPDANLTTFIPPVMRATIYVLVSTWWINVILMNAMYRSQIASSMFLTPKTPKRISQLLNEGYTFAYHSYYLTQNSILSDHERSIIERHTSCQIRDLCQVPALIESDKVLVIGEYTKYTHHTRAACEKYNFSHRHLRIDFAATPHAFLFQTGVPFVEMFDKEISQIMTGGLIEMWEKTLLHRRKIFKQNQMKSHEMRFGNFLAQFFVFIVGCALSLVCFLFETFVY